LRPRRRSRELRCAQPCRARYGRRRNRRRRREQTVRVEPALEVEPAIQKLVADRSNVDLRVDQPLVCAAGAPNARGSLAEQQCTSELAVAQDELAVRNAAGAAREIHDLLRARIGGDAADAGEIEVEQTRCEVMGARIVARGLTRDVSSGHPAL
jgi:hypothetical protein